MVQNEHRAFTFSSQNRFQFVLFCNQLLFNISKRCVFTFLQSLANFAQSSSKHRVSIVLFLSTKRRLLTANSTSGLKQLLIQPIKALSTVNKYF